ncbi:thiol reductant ABC exporter subunit CydD [Actinopolymorpha alba]|uniref:thiol reductant ABC exporter subunit CydD n=1 Tax=Actinopolymorpha alba TaxID=533267 RepID=UPI00039B86FA|nr:thiol reductant ABC exporter subunit CydD [Actinopolymorpha alba]
MRPFDPRLLRHARAGRAHLGTTVGIGIAQAGLVLAQAALLATMISAAFLDDRGLAALAGPLGLLVLVVAARAGLAFATEWAAQRTSAAVKKELRQLLLHHVVRLGPRWLSGERSGELATLASRGVDALDGYFARYLPQLVLAGLIPLAVAGTLLAADQTSALVVILTVPLIPAFMVLVGVVSRRRMDRQWTTLQALAHHFLDILSGLGTLKAFGRSRAQVTMIRKLADQQRRASLSTLRLAFLSSFVLELLATLSVAMVAVGVGLRLVDGQLDLRTALLVLIVAPEAYLPLRQAAAHYHASVEGLAAAGQVFDVLEQDAAGVGQGTTDRRRSDHAGGPAADPRSALIRLDDVTVLGSDRAHPLLDRLSLEFTPGQVTGLVAPSGAGKSTVLGLLLGFVTPDSGRVLVNGHDLADLDLDAWRARVGWLPQDPVLFAGTVADNIRLRHPQVDDSTVAAIARAAAVDVPLTLELGERGYGVSAGQRRRIALARALLSDAPLLLLDEPTEGVDPETEAALLATFPRLLVGRTVVLVTHRPGLLRLCQHVVRLDHVGVAA